MSLKKLSMAALLGPVMTLASSPLMDEYAYESEAKTLLRRSRYKVNTPKKNADAKRRRLRKISNESRRRNR